MYEGTSWQLSSEHILYTLGHTKFMLKDFAAAAEFFNCLMEGSVGDGRQGGHLQQMVHLREFFLVHHARAKEDRTAVPCLSLPRLHSNSLTLGLGGERPSGEQLELWQAVEKVVKEVVWGQDLVSLPSTCQPVFSPSTTNQLAPQARVGEDLEVTVSLENVFSTALQLKRLQLLWKFLGEEGEEQGGVDSRPLEVVTLDRSSRQEVPFVYTYIAYTCTFSRTPAPAPALYSSGNFHLTTSEARADHSLRDGV